ncbi:hypothetical protein CCUS01_13726, partial [Colletotrichum cuscutae]
IHNGKKNERPPLLCIYRRAHRAAYIHSDPARYRDQIALFFRVFERVALAGKKKKKV